MLEADRVFATYRPASSTFLISNTDFPMQNVLLRSLPKTGELFGLKYIYGELTRREGKDPLDFPARMENPTEYEVVVINALTGLPEYYGREMMEQDDYRLIMASSVIPVRRALEREGTAFVFAASEPIRVGTYSMKEDAERNLYDLGLRDFAAWKNDLLEFLSI